MSNISNVDKARSAAYAAVGGFKDVFSSASPSVLEDLYKGLNKQLGQLYCNKNEPEQSATISHTKRM